MGNKFLWFFRVSPWHMFLECWKLVKSKEVLRKACVQNRVSVIFAALRRHEDEKENIPLSYPEIIDKKSQDSYSLGLWQFDSQFVSNPRFGQV